MSTDDVRIGFGEVKTVLTVAEKLAVNHQRWRRWTVHSR